MKTIRAAIQKYGMKVYIELTVNTIASEVWKLEKKIYGMSNDLLFDGNWLRFGFFFTWIAGRR